MQIINAGKRIAYWQLVFDFAVSELKYHKCIHAAVVTNGFAGGWIEPWSEYSGSQKEGLDEPFSCH